MEVLVAQLDYLLVLLIGKWSLIVVDELDR